MTNDDILALARDQLADWLHLGNLAVTGSAPKMPADARDLVGLAFVAGDWMRAVGLGRREKLTPALVLYGARDLARQVEQRATKGRRRA